MSEPQPIRIIIVDDEAAQMKALCDTLGTQGYVTTGFTSSKAALDALRTEKFDLLLTDLMMPEMDGIDLLRGARELDENLVGIMMTGNATIPTAIDAMKAGAFDYVMKPFKLTAIMPVLQRAATMRRLRLDNAALARRVAERTEELETVNRELEAFSYSVAHDLRAPLRAMSGFAGMLVQDHAESLPAEARALLTRVVDNANKMSQLIEALLRLSRLNRQSLSAGRIPMATLVGGIVDELKGDAAGREITVDVGDLPDAVGDHALVKQLLTNLLSNAFKFTQKVPRANVAVRAEQRDGKTVYSVRDNGAGFDSKDAANLFAVFHRLHGTDYEGTGVGLSIVQRIAHRHGGQVWAEAEVDKGATFYFTLGH